MRRQILGRGGKFHPGKEARDTRRPTATRAASPPRRRAGWAGSVGFFLVRAEPAEGPPRHRRRRDSPRSGNSLRNVRDLVRCRCSRACRGQRVSGSGVGDAGQGVFQVGGRGRAFGVGGLHVAAVVREGVELRAADLATMPGHQRTSPHRLAHVGHRVEPAVRHAFDQVDHLVGCIIVVGLPDQPGAVGREGHPLQRRMPHRLRNRCLPRPGRRADRPCCGRPRTPRARPSPVAAAKDPPLSGSSGQSAGSRPKVANGSAVPSDPILERVCRFVGRRSGRAARSRSPEALGVRDVDPAFVPRTRPRDPSDSPAGRRETPRHP